jgi:hypothetical protein
MRSLRRSNVVAAAFLASLSLLASEDPSLSSSRQSGARAGSGFAGALSVTIPSDISRAEVVDGSAAARERLLALAHGCLASRWHGTLLPGHDTQVQRDETAAIRKLDVVITLLDSDGEPILPDLERLSERSAVGAATNELRFTFDSTLYPWSPDEVSRLTSALARFYPVAKAVYGPPAFDITVNVVKNPTIGYAGAYTPPLNTITLSDGENLDVLCHEMIHAFRDDLIAAPSIYEEGMVRAAEIEVYDRLGFDTWISGHDYTYDRYYDALNTEAIGAKNGNFFFNVPATFLVLRYQLAGYAWGKAVIESPSFLADFNRAYLVRAIGEPAVRQDAAALRQIAASVLRGVEGTDFDTWYGLQGVFETMPPEGCQLYSRINQYTVDYFCRDSSGTETMQSGAIIDWSVYDHHGTLMSSGSETTTSYGWISTGSPPSDYAGRLTVAASVSGQPFITTSALRSMRGESGTFGVFGVVPSALLGTVTVSSLDEKAVRSTVPVRDGEFYAPAVAGKRGRFRAALQTSDGRRVARRFTRDWGSYFLTMDCGTTRPLATTTAIVSSRNPSIAGRDVTFDAVVTATPPAVFASGVVTFRAGQVAISGCADLDLTTSGKATCTTASLAAGSYSITAAFAPDCGFGASASAPLTQVVASGVRRRLQPSTRP